MLWQPSAVFSRCIEENQSLLEVSFTEQRQAESDNHQLRDWMAEVWPDENVKYHFETGKPFAMPNSRYGLHET